MLSRAYFGLDRVFPVILDSQDRLSISFTQLLLWLSGLFLIVLLAVSISYFIRINRLSKAVAGEIDE